MNNDDDSHLGSDFSCILYDESLKETIDLIDKCSILNG